MSEVQNRSTSSRGRGSYRGGRGGYRGARGGKPTQTQEPEHTPTIEDEGEVGELKAKYSDKLPLLREVCEGWSDEDLVFALQEVDGDLNAALDRITTGAISQWGEVKKKPKVKESTTSSFDAATRGRGRGGAEGRGRGRGSGTERVARAGRGARIASHTNGTKAADKPQKTTEEAFGEAATEPVTHAAEETATNGNIASEAVAESTKEQPAIAHEEKRSAPAAVSASSKVSGWAGLFAKPPPPPPAAKKAPAPSPGPVSAPEEIAPIVAPEEPAAEIIPPPIEPIQVDDALTELPSTPHSATDANIELTPSKDELTEKNLDQLPDTSQPIATATAASTVASTQDPMNPAVPVTPAVRPGMSGFATSALKATQGMGRSASYSRKLIEQQEAVVMPGNHAVDRAAVQFGKMGMNGDEDEADEEREEPETRTQLPDDSPAAPRASLPPAVPGSKPVAEAAPEELALPRPAPGLPPAPQQAQQHSPQQTSPYADQYRYGQEQKAYDPFTQQSQAQPPTTEAFSSQIPAQSHGAPGLQDYPQYYGANTRDAYQQYYGGYGQGHEAQRSASGYGSSAQEIPGQHATGRAHAGYGQLEGPDSGHNTPNPTASSQQSQQSQHLAGQSAQSAQSGYPYGYPNAYGQQYPQYGGGSYMGAGGMSQRYGQNRPMFDDVRRSDSDYYGGNQYSYGHSQQQYGNSYKSSMYGQPQQHQYSHDYSSSPAGNASFGGREAAYGRAGSTQPSESQQGAGGSAFSTMSDLLGRTSSGFGQSQGHGSHQGSEEQPKASGPSPSLQGNRPGSALNNNMSGHQQSAGPHQQSQHSGQGFVGYPQYAGFGGNQNHQNTGYGAAYGSNAGFGGYGGGYGRGWSGNYGSGHN